MMLSTYTNTMKLYKGTCSPQKFPYILSTNMYMNMLVTKKLRAKIFLSFSFYLSTNSKPTNSNLT